MKAPVMESSHDFGHSLCCRIRLIGVESCRVVSFTSSVSLRVKSSVNTTKRLKLDVVYIQSDIRLHHGHEKSGGFLLQEDCETNTDHFLIDGFPDCGLL